MALVQASQVHRHSVEKVSYTWRQARHPEKVTLSLNHASQHAVNSAPAASLILMLSSGWLIVCVVQRECKAKLSFRHSAIQKRADVSMSWFNRDRAPLIRLPDFTI